MGENIMIQQTNKTEMKTIKQKKIVLCPYDDKRVWIDDNLSQPYGYDTPAYDEDNTLDRIIENCANRVKISVDQFMSYLGCAREEFKHHLLEKLPFGQTFISYGSGKGCWNIDHINPVSSGESAENLSHYTNLQPMTIEENSSKGGISRSTETETETVWN